jgi:DNA-binding NtrC family response regulator
VHLILLDMLMEPGMNGCQTYAEVVKKHPGQKAVIASGYSEGEDVFKAYQFGVAGFIKKPFTITQLGQMVRKALHT